MRIILLLLGFFCQVDGLYAQVIELKNQPIEVTGRKFFISHVMDSRADTTKIGWCFLNKEKRGQAYTFSSGLSKSLLAYFNNSLKSDTGQVPLIVNVVSLVISEKKGLMAEGKAQLSVQFLREENGLLGKVFSTTLHTTTTSEFAKDIYTTHERRIRFVFQLAFQKLQASSWREIQPDYISKAELMQEAVALDTLSKSLLDTAGMFAEKRKAELEQVQLAHIGYSNGFLPSFTLQGKRYKTLWAFKKQFAQLNDKQVNRYFSNYKGKIRLSLVTLAVGGALLGFAFSDPTMEDGMPNLTLVVPGAAFVGCSIPIYLQSKKWARKTVETYNEALSNK